MSALSLSDAEPETRHFRHLISNYFTFWVISGIFQNIFFPLETVFHGSILTDALMFLHMKNLNKDRKETHFLQNRQDGEFSKGLGRKKNWPDSQGDIAARDDISFISITIYICLFLCFDILHSAEMSSFYCNIKIRLTSWIWGWWTGQNLVPRFDSEPICIFSLWKAPFALTIQSFACVGRLHTAGFYLLD